MDGRVSDPAAFEVAGLRRFTLRRRAGWSFTVTLVSDSLAVAPSLLVSGPGCRVVPRRGAVASRRPLRAGAGGAGRLSSSSSRTQPVGLRQANAERSTLIISTRQVLKPARARATLSRADVAMSGLRGRQAGSRERERAPVTWVVTRAPRPIAQRRRCLGNSERRRSAWRAPEVPRLAGRAFDSPSRVSL